MTCATSVVSAAILTAVLASPGSGAPYPAEQRLFLGFEVGEERRYVLGPEEEMHPGEGGNWSIRLRELLGDPADGVFELTHEWQRGEDPFEPALGTVIQTASSGEIRVNQYGFPLDVEFATKRHLAGFGDVQYSIRYRYEDRRYLKFASLEDETWEASIDIPSHDDVDLSSPRGLHALVAASLDCSLRLAPNLRQAAAVRNPLPTAGTSTSPAPPSPPLRLADNGFCKESLFANPALLSLMLPELWERATGEREFLLLTPTGPSGRQGFSVGGQVGGVGAGAGGFADSRSGVRPRGDTDVRTLRYLDRVEVEVGPRVREAWRFDKMDEFRAIYVDDDDVVLRVDIVDGGRQQLGVVGSGGAAVSFDPTQRRPRDLFIRLLFPSEY